MPPPNRQAPRRRKTREALIRAGVSLLAERPIDAIPVNDIVARAGVAKGSFFNHFNDKADFAAAVATEIRGVVESRVEAMNEGVHDPAARLARGICAFVQFGLTEHNAARVMRRQPRWSEAAHPLNAGLRADVDLGLASGRFRSRSPEAAVTYVIGVCQMILTLVIDRPLGAADAGALTLPILELLLTGLGVPAAETPEICASAVATIRG